MKTTFTISLFALFVFNFRPCAGQQLEQKHPVITSREADSLRVSVINKELHLSSEESRKFWPVYNDFSKELNLLDQEYFKKLNLFKKNIDQLNDNELNRFIADDFDFQQQRIDLKKKYNTLLRSFLSLRKLAHYYIAQDQYARQLIRYRILKALPAEHPKPTAH